MSSPAEIVIVSLVGLAVTSSNIIGAALGLYLRPSKQLLACILAFAAGALITALASASAWLRYAARLALRRRRLCGRCRRLLSGRPGARQRGCRHPLSDPLSRICLLAPAEGRDRDYPASH